ncbi:MAG: hypothetical protein Q8868_02290 [Bacteroidota bacterium]|nr:hypothetical protein [Bacteroidota bacterium]
MGKEKTHEKKDMHSKYFSLELHKSNKVTRIFELVFGIVCLGVALVWLILNFSSLESNFSLWATIIFLSGFGYFQVISGLGRSEKFIEISDSSIKIKRNMLLPYRELRSDEIEKIEILPLNVIFYLKSGKSLFLRFGATYTDTIDPVKKGIKAFCSSNNIDVRIKIEEI